ncbi:MULTISPECIES: helix-turn-helix domain-containing protein [Sphingobacterium]|uniref:helix-turn-helix domain-containing protein n=1 Tax=Sphingobacterium TaxID=28453 RepID=UPI002579E9AC|nr:MULTISPECIES: helix-turn-helix domain-containing protein [Sphingobacterium]
MKINPTKKESIGPKIRKLRQIKGLSQKMFASELSVSQQAVSKLENSDTINEETLQKISDVLGVSIETIANFDEDAAFTNIIEKNEVINQRCDIVNNFDSTEKITALYERLLESEKEKNAILKQLLELKNS